MAKCSIDGCTKPARTRGWCIAHYTRWYRNGDPLRGYTPRGEALKFLRTVAVPFKGDDCLPWPHYRDSQGYAKIWLNGRLQKATRVVCEAAHGAPPSPELHAAHSCGNGHEGCVNPKHLRWATAAENLRDRERHGTILRGENHARTTLTEEQVRAIRATRGLSHREIAKKFNVARSTVGQIIRGTRWGWLDEAERKPR